MPTLISPIPRDAADYLAEQLGVYAVELSGYDFGGRTARRHCAEILGRVAKIFALTTP
ncbi:DUF4158 domain-containing protein [Stappia sp. BW2]|uniref:DUF4158 domain-containing protein n=1 Tax=Stappia sp. BW2 TaxID=2592622 RepID=UPI0011DE683E|nr:DUF4158 domain-containing protein [Stappia sp. BW2]TYC78555.1 DUF4158 domain-containing protein [Stappia sp. BW2]